MDVVRLRIRRPFDPAERFPVGAPHLDYALERGAILESTLAQRGVQGRGIGDVDAPSTDRVESIMWNRAGRPAALDRGFDVTRPRPRGRVCAFRPTVHGEGPGVFAVGSQRDLDGDGAVRGESERLLEAQVPHGEGVG